jgi:hypothetical protein
MTYVGAGAGERWIGAGGTYLRPSVSCRAPCVTTQPTGVVIMSKAFPMLGNNHWHLESVSTRGEMIRVQM